MDPGKIDVRYIAHLARLKLSDEEVERYQGQLAHVLEYVQKLQAVDVTGVEPTAHATPVYNAFREDGALPSLEQTEALANAPRQASGLFVVPKVL